MNKKANLVAALHEASGKKQSGYEANVPEGGVGLVPIGKPPSRIGKKVVAGHFDPAVVRQLKLMALENDTSIQSLLTEALNELFQKYNLKPIA